uniref:Methyltransferase domain protein n=1 Tax=Pithovirus LCPAC304 TaxID=2506594 RepID=A0A481Z7V8_9VIRU|nr:MAG: methyltransferase domain protein [Pithovirus LCPAC304]
MSFYGQFDTDKFIQKYFATGYIGTCVDVGMGEPLCGSNTYHFEENGWTCLCVEPNTTYCQQAKGIRKHVENVACGAEHADDQNFDIYTINGDNQTAISSLKPDARLIKSHFHMINTIHSIAVKVRTLDEVLAAHPYIEKIDFISIDTENTELDVLKGFDVGRWNPKLIVIENNYDEPFLGDYLKQFGYERVERVGVNDFFLRSE